MLYGAEINYPYWATFNLQRVFPQLQDKLFAFPKATIYNTIIRDWPAERPKLSLFKTTELEQKLNQLYGAYILALSKGAQPYQLADRNPKFATASFMVTQTGLDRGLVVAFLSTLEKLAKGGGIPLEYWNPKKAIELNKAVQKVKAEVAATRPKGALEDTVDKVGTTAKWVLVAVAVAAGGFAISQVRKVLP